MANHYAGQEVCSCTYDVQYFRDYPRLLAEFRANRVYDSTYADKSRLLPTTNDGSPFYTALNVSQDLKDTASPTWSGFAYPYYAHDSSTPIGHYSTSYVSYSRPEEVISIKKPPTREMTATLKAWLNEHKKNPYPTKAEKIMLAIITKMTLTQVSTWFANARRRLKKDNKVTWEVKNRTDNEDGDEERRETDEERRDMEDDRRDTEEEGIIDNSNHLCGASYSVNEEAKLKVNDDSSSTSSPKLEVSGKPRIWSLADTAMSPDTTMSDHGISTHIRPVQLRHLAANYSLNESAFERVGFATSMHLLPERDYAFSNVVASNLSENLS